MIGNPEINNPKSLPARTFRRQFRLPFPVFDKIIVPECDRLNVFEFKDSARVRLPTEFKVMIFVDWDTSTIWMCLLIRLDCGQVGFEVGCGAVGGKWVSPDVVGIEVVGD